MNYLGDSGQRASKILTTDTDITTLGSSLSSVTYYVRKLRSSLISVFVSTIEGVKNGTYYGQGNLVLTKDPANQTTASLLQGNLIIHAKPGETYSLDEYGHLICTTEELS